jgi:TolB-like protein
MLKRFCRHLTLLAMIVCMSRSNVFAAVGSGAQYTLAVLPFDASGRITTAEAGLLSARLAAELEQLGVFMVTPQSTVNAALPNGGAGCGTVPCGVEVGKQLAVKLVVNGSVRKVGQIYFVETQMIHVNSGQVVERANEDFDGDFAQLQNRMANVARKLVGKSSFFDGDVATGAMTATDYSGATSGEAGAASGKSAEYRSGSNKFLIYGLVAVGAVGAAVGITQLTKGSDNKNNNTKPPATGSELPDPPVFP